MFRIRHGSEHCLGVSWTAALIATLLGPTIHKGPVPGKFAVTLRDAVDDDIDACCTREVLKSVSVYSLSQVQIWEILCFRELGNTRL
jgi:hypothetical protein